MFLQGKTKSPPWYANGLHFECQPDCHKCCKKEGIVVLTPPRSKDHHQEEQIADHLGVARDEFREKFVHTDPVNGSYLEDGPEGGCPFLCGSGCSVYTVRPRQCRTYPFWPEVVKSRALWEKEAAFCPGINKGRFYSREEIEERSEAPV